MAIRCMLSGPSARCKSCPASNVLDSLPSVQQALSYACSQWASLPREEVVELPPDLLLALLGSEALEVSHTCNRHDVAHHVQCGTEVAWSPTMVKIITLGASDLFDVARPVWGDCRVNLLARTAQARAEADVLAAAVAWLDADPGPRLAHVGSLLATVRMAPSEAASRVRAST